MTIIRKLIFLVLFCYVNVSALDVQLIRVDTVEAPTPITYLDPILGADCKIDGYLLLFENASMIRLVWLDHSPQVDIVVPSVPAQSLHWQDGDTLVIVACLTADQISESMKVVRIAVIGTEISMTDVSLSIPQCLSGVSFDDLASNLSGQFDSDGACTELIVSTSMLASSIYGFEPENARCSHTWVITPDLQEVVYEGNHARFIPGQFSTDSIPQFAGFYNYWYQTWREYEGPYGWERDEYFITNSYVRLYGLSSGAVDTLFARSSPHDTAFAIFGDDVTDDYSHDELIYYGIGQSLDDINPLSHHLACYNFCTGVPQEVWFRPVNWRTTPYNLQYQNQKGGLLVGFPIYGQEGGGWVHLIDYRAGQFVDSIDLGRDLLNPAFSETPSDSVLLMSGNVGDTLYTYRFDVVTDIPDDRWPLPASFTLSQNYPNPFNATTEIRFNLARATEVKLTVYNLLGQEVRTLNNGRTSAGEHRVTWDGRGNSGESCATGVYLYRIQTADIAQSRKMLLLK